MADSNYGAPPAYMLDRPDTLRQPWWNVKSWGWKKFAILIGAVVIILIIVIVVAVEVTKKNKYPDYTKLTYKLADTCKHILTSLMDLY